MEKPIRLGSKALHEDGKDLEYSFQVQTLCKANKINMGNEVTISLGSFMEFEPHVQYRLEIGDDTIKVFANGAQIKLLNIKSIYPIDK